jgi:hypothetical protein
MPIALLFWTALQALGGLLGKAVSTDSFWQGVERVIRAGCDLIVTSKHPHPRLQWLAGECLALLNDIDAQRAAGQTPKV